MYNGYLWGVLVVSLEAALDFGCQALDGGGSLAMRG